MTEPRWLEVSLVVSGELAEALADVLGRHVSNGVVVESGVRYNDAEDEGTPVGPVKVYGYLPADERLEERRQRLEEALWYLGRIQPLPAPEYRPIEDEDWMAAWKKHYHPIPIGKKLLVLPAWLDQADLGRTAIRIDPSMAFGTGTHPTTQLCLELLEELVRPGVEVIDVGCGSGILSIGAVLLGSGPVTAVDIDDQAVRSTRENAAVNHTLEMIETGQGSVREVLDGCFQRRQAPLVLANILAPVILRLFEQGLEQLVSPGGNLVLSGILAEQAEGVSAAAAGRGLQPLATRQSGDWVALAFQKA